MSFYESLSEYYDIIFPRGEAQSSFLEESFKKESKLLDLAAGTGVYTFYLNEKGYKIDAIELSSTMCNKFKAKLKDPFQLTVFEMDMRLLDEFLVKYDGIYCIGNSIVHLGNLEEIELMIEKIYNKLETGGKIVLQIVNYDRIFSKKITELPTIENLESEVVFERKYILKEDSVEFHGTLKTKEEISESTVILFALKKEMLQVAFEKIGFEKIEFFGSFDKKPWSIDSFATIVRATK